VADSQDTNEREPPSFRRPVRTDTLHAARTFRAGFQWDFYESDLNESARALFRRLDDVFHILKADGHVFLSTIELEAEVGRFPESWFSTTPGRITFRQSQAKRSER
jgi:hypothetical protein